VRAPASALVLPLGLLAAALVALPDAESPAGGLVAGTWAALATAAAWRARPRGEAAAAPTFGAHVAVAGLASALVPVVLIEHGVARLVALAAHAAILAEAYARTRARLALLAPLVVLGTASASCLDLLRDRPAYAYPPFATGPSLAAAALVAAWATLAWRVWRAAPGSGDPAAAAAPTTPGERAAVIGAAAVAALLWGREELARAVSPDVSTFLLVGYFAAVGIAAIFAGRARRVPAARQAGLALAIYAALKALAQVSDLDAVGLRVGSYLLVGGFLLAVGYWYRSADTA
jgi:hypothetical protein